MKSLTSLNSIFKGHTVASSADGIPLDTFTPAGAQLLASDPDGDGELAGGAGYAGFT